MLGVRNGTDGNADGRLGSGNSLRDHRGRGSRESAQDAKSAHKRRAYGWHFRTGSRRGRDLRSEPTRKKETRAVEAQYKRLQGTIA